MSTPPHFKQDPKRDASAAIRGYFYQIRQTLLRWVTLTETSTLLCECCEDLDRVSRVVTKQPGDVTFERVAEQFKDLPGSTLTLLSDDIQIAFANFLQASRINSGWDLHYKLTTTATSGKERTYKFPGGQGGLEACSRLTVPPDAHTLSTLKVFREIATRPLSADSGTLGTKLSEWRLFAQSSSDEELAAFLQRFDWTFDAPSGCDVNLLIRQALIKTNMVAEVNCQFAIDRLTVIIVELLSSPGEKRLDATMLKEALNCADTHSEAQANILSRLAQLESSLIERIDAIDSSIKSVQRDVASARASIENKFEAMVLTLLANQETLLAHQQLLTVSLASVQQVTTRLDILPRPPAIHLKRRQPVLLIQEQLDSATVFNIWGEQGIGKTQVLAEIVDSSAPASIWISCKVDAGREAQHIAAQLRGHLATKGILTIAGGQPVATKALATAVFTTSVMWVIIDDLPDISLQDNIIDLLSELAEEAAARRGKLLLSSKRELPGRIRKQLARPGLFELRLQAWHTEDVKRLLSLSGAPSELCTDAYAEVFRSVAGGHPIILQDALAWFEGRGWADGSDTILHLIGGEPVKETRRENLRRLIQLVPHEQERELLLRLAVHGGRFGKVEVDAVANLEPAIARPGELLQTLIGPWISEADGKYRLSSLLDNAAQLAMTETQYKQLSSVLAESLLKRGSLTPDTAIRALILLNQAAEFARAGIALAHMLLSVQTSEQAHSLSLLTMFYGGVPWPEEIGEETRYIIRAQQLRVIRLANGDARRLEEDLEKMLSSPPASHAARAAYCYALFVSGPAIDNEPVTFALSRALRLLEFASQEPDIGTLMAIPRHFISDLLWMPLVRARKPEEITFALNLLEDIKPEILETALESNIANESLQLFADACWLGVAPEDEKTNDWNNTLKLIDSIGSFGRKRGIEVLSAAATRARAIVLADYLAQGEEAHNNLVSAKNTSNTNASRFILAYTDACILQSLGKFAEGLISVSEALTADCTEMAFLRHDSYCKALTLAMLSHEHTAALALGRRGVNFAFKTLAHWTESEFRRPDNTPNALPFVFNQIEIIAELALAYWSTGDGKRACGCLFGAVTRFISYRSAHTPRWNEVRRKIGHAVMSTTLLHPKVGSDFERVPPPGFMTTRNTQLGEVTDTAPYSAGLLWWLLGQLAVSNGLMRMAAHCMSLAYAELKQRGPIAYCVSAYPWISAIAAFNGDKVTSFKIGNEYIQCIAVSFTLDRSDPKQTELTAEQAASMWASVPTVVRDNAADQLINTVFIPWVLGALIRRESSTTIDSWLAEYENVFGNATSRLTSLCNIARNSLQHRAGARVLNSNSSVTERLVSCIVGGEFSGESLQDVARCHVLALCHLAEAEPGMSLVYFCQYISEYWRRIATERAFLIGSPRSLARLCEEETATTLPGACRLLLATEDATGLRIPQTVKSKLVTWSQQDKVRTRE